MASRINRKSLIKQKARGKKWAMLTAYDAPTAAIVAEAGADFLLVGDSLGMVLLGYESTAVVTMDEMIHHAKAVRRGAPDACIVGDLPLKGIQGGPKQALQSARRFLTEGGCDGVKLEWSAAAPKIVEELVGEKIPVMGHVGLTPQTTAQDGFKVQAVREDSALNVFHAAQFFERCGAFAVLMECIPVPVATAITGMLKVPTIGIGAGPHCDGQVLVFHDIVGLFKKFTPRFVKRYADLEAPMKRAVKQFISEVEQGKFPGKEHGFAMPEEEKREFESRVSGLLPTFRRRRK